MAIPNSLTAREIWWRWEDKNPYISRLVNIMSHGAYPYLNPTEMGEENKEYFRSIYKTII